LLAEDIAGFEKASFIQPISVAINALAGCLSPETETAHWRKSQEA